MALITIEVHARDVIDKLTKSNCSSVNDFEWVSQLRFYWDRDLNECVVKQVGGCGVLSNPCCWVAGTLRLEGGEQAGRCIRSLRVGGWVETVKPEGGRRGS